MPQGLQALSSSLNTISSSLRFSATRIRSTVSLTLHNVQFEDAGTYYSVSVYDNGSARAFDNNSMIAVESTYLSNLNNYN